MNYPEQQTRRRNIELKARCADLSKAAAAARGLGAIHTVTAAMTKRPHGQRLETLAAALSIHLADRVAMSYSDLLGL